MPIISPSTLTRLISQIQRHSHAWLESGSELVVPPRQIVRKFSLMLRFLVKDSSVGNRAILVKIARYQGMDFDVAVADQSLVMGTIREYEMLRSIERIFSREMPERIFCHVRPLAVLEEWNALVTEELVCVPLKNYYFRIPLLLGWTKDWQTFEILLERSGHWLRVYHQGMGAQGVDTLQQTRLHEKIEELLTQVLTVMPGKEAGQIRNMVEISFSEAPFLSLPMAVLHGDFHCSNLLITPDLRVGSLDADAGRGPIYEDIAKLIADLETRSLQVYTFGLFIPPHRMTRLRNAVLRGYFASTQVNQYLLESFLTLAILTKWKIDEELLMNATGIQRIIRKILSPFRRRYMLHILKKHLSVLALEIESLQSAESTVAV